MAWTPRHDKLLFLSALAFGVLVLPFFVYLTGTYVFGSYASGGALGFVGDFMRGLATFRWYAWLLALGPLAIVAVWRGLWRLAAPNQGREQGTGIGDGERSLRAGPSPALRATSPAERER